MADGENPPAQRETALDVTAEQIARTYAQGVLGAAGDAAESVVQELEAVRDEVLAAHPRFGETLSSAFLDHEERVAVINRTLGGRVGPITLNVLKVLSSHDRAGLIGAVAQQARKLFDARINREAVTVRLAAPVDDALMGEIEQRVRETTGVEPVVTVEIDESLVGGLEIRVGDRVYDGSLRTAFAKAHATIVAQTVEAIETKPERFTLAE
ncbi:MAG: ATP synthase F1 subunit delta [Planctomycetota bacterium]